jgi:hypothetical protein
VPLKTTLRVAGWLVNVVSLVSKIADRPLPPGIVCVRIKPLLETAPLTQSFTAWVTSIMM